MNKLDTYDTFVFDCDGVILNSNNYKSEAFFKSTLKYGKENAKKFKNYHIKNGGISRNIKFKYFFETILKKKDYSKDLDEAINVYSDIVKIDLEKSDITPNLSQLKKKYKKQNWLVVSGSNQNELQQVFKKRKIDKYFDSGIYGSPKDKITILNELRSASTLKKKTIYFGDSLYDYECSKKCNIDFCFVSKWSELKDWKDIFRNKDIKTISSLEDLI